MLRAGKVNTVVNRMPSRKQQRTNTWKLTKAHTFNSLITAPYKNTQVIPTS